MEAPGADRLKSSGASSGPSEVAPAQTAVVVPASEPSLVKTVTVPTAEAEVISASKPVKDKTVVPAPGTAAIEEVEISAPVDSALQEDIPTQAKKKKGFFSKGKRLFKRLGSGKKE